MKKGKKIIAAITVYAFIVSTTIITYAPLVNADYPDQGGTGQAAGQPFMVQIAAGGTPLMQMTSTAPYLLFITVEGKKYRVTYKQGGFPEGTEGYWNAENGYYTFAYKLPGFPNLTPITTDMVTEMPMSTPINSRMGPAPGRPIQEFDIPDFVVDRAEIPSSANNIFASLAAKINAAITNDVVYILPSHSDEDISHKYCWVSRSVPPYYLPTQPDASRAAHFTKVAGQFYDGDNVTCQAELALARGRNSKDRFVQLGVPADRIQISRWGGTIDIDSPHATNRGVRVLLIPRTIYENPPPAPVEVVRPCPECPGGTIRIYYIIQVVNAPTPVPGDGEETPRYIEPPPPIKKDPPGWVKWAYMLGTAAVFAGGAFLATQAVGRGGQGAGDAGDGGDGQFCQDGQEGACIAIAGAAGIPVGYLLYRLIEKPGKKVKQRLNRPHH